MGNYDSQIEALRGYPYDKGLPSDFRKALHELRDKAMPHTRTKFSNDIDQSFSNPRPLETEKDLKWRNDNYRQFTKQYFNDFVSVSSKIFDRSISIENKSDELKEWLQTKPFVTYNRTLSDSQFLRQIVLPQTYENPNHILIALPYKKSLGLSQAPLFGDVNEKVLPLPLLLSYDRVTYMTDSMMTIYYGDTKVDQTMCKVYFTADSEWWYRHYPVKENDQIVYKDELWYKHDTGESIFNSLAGRANKSWDGNFQITSSYIDHFYEVAGETMHVISDDKIIRTRNCQMLMVIEGQRCEECDGTGVIPGMSGKTECTSCKGKGIKEIEPSPFGMFQHRPKSNFDKFNDNEGNANNDLPIKWISAPTENATHSFEVMKEFRQMCESALWLDLLRGAGANASAEALEQRKDKLSDVFQEIAHGVYASWVTFLWQCECILVRRPNTDGISDPRQRPSARIPSKIKLKTEKELFDEANNAFKVNKLDALLEAYQAKYIDQPKKYRKMRILLTSNWLYTLSNDELRDYIAKDIISEYEIKRMELSPIALDRIAQRPDFMDGLTDDQVKSMIETMLIEDFGLEKPVDSSPIDPSQVGQPVVR